MSVERQQQDWDSLAQADALWAVLTAPGRKGGGWDVDEFFASGEAEIAQVLETAVRLGRPARRERALDFGCGVGRLTRALGDRFDSVVGIDISAGMIEQARRLNDGLTRCEFQVNVSPDLTDFATGSFDLVYSTNVLQHLASAAEIERFVVEFLRTARKDGLVVFGLPHRIAFPYSLQPRRRLYAVLRTLGVSELWLLQRTPLTPMRMTAVPEEKVRDLVAAHGARVLVAEQIDAGPVRARRYYVSPR